MNLLFSEKLLLVLADIADFHSAVRSQTKFSRYQLGDLSVRKNRLEIMKYFEELKKKNKLYPTFYNLKRSGYLSEAKKGEYILTGKAKEKIDKLKFKKINKLNKFRDNKMLLVLFDIPETRKRDRDQFRRVLKELDFIQLQKSIWLTNKDSVKEVVNVIKSLKIDNYVEMLKINKVKNIALNKFS